MIIERILISGINGKLGQAIHAELSKQYTLIGHYKHECLTTKILSSNPDLIIDVSSAQTITKHLDIYLQLQKPTIVGTSGLSPQQAAQYTQQACFPLLIVPNFSHGFRMLLQQAITLRPHYSNIDIIETHHQSKKDTPSGSSLFLANALHYPVQKIISKRVPEYTASHQVVFHSPYDSFSLQHSLYAPEMFIAGVIEAIAHIQRLTHGEVMLSPPVKS